MIRSFYLLGRVPFIQNSLTAESMLSMTAVHPQAGPLSESRLPARLSRGRRFRQFLFPIYTKITSTDFHFCYPTAVWNVCTFHS